MRAPSRTIADYACRYWLRAGMTEWPTVRQVARALGLRQRDVEAEEGGDFMLTGYNIEDHVLGDLSVEASTPEVDAAWCTYWLPYSRRCCCGRHDVPAR